MTNTGKNTSGNPGEAIQEVLPQPRPAQGWSGANFGRVDYGERGCCCHAHCTTVCQTPTSNNPDELRYRKSCGGGLSPYTGTDKRMLSLT